MQLGILGVLFITSVAINISRIIVLLMDKNSWEKN